MTNNFLHPEYLPDLAEGLLTRQRHRLPPDMHAILVRKLVEHFHHDEDCAIPVATLPTGALAWATVGAVCHPAPSSEVYSQVRAGTETIHKAIELRASGMLKATNSQLHADCGAMLRGLPHRTWRDLRHPLLELGCELEAWEWTERPTKRRPYRVPGADGRKWRAIRSPRELWEAGRGSQWCFRRGVKNPRELYDSLGWFPELNYWVLEERGRPVACLSSEFRIAEVEVPEIHQIKDTANRTAVAYRADVLAFIQGPAFWVDEQARHGIDYAVLAIDQHLGLPGQPWRNGEVRSRLAKAQIRYRLWAEEGQGRYLVGFPSDGSEPFDRYLRLDVSVRSEFGRWVLSGSRPPAWRGTMYELMIRVLKAAYPGRGRPAHVRRALRRLDEERTGPHANVFA